MSSFTTFLALITLLPFTTAFLIDIDGDNLRNFGKYYIIVRATGAGLSYTQINGECPLYITSENTDNSLGTPVKINTRLRQEYIKLDDHVTLTFVDSSGTKPPCKGSLTWKQTQNSTSGKAYVTTGGGGRIAQLPFAITKTDKSFLPTFELQYCDANMHEEDVCSNVGLFSNGLLGMTRYPTTISFKKAFTVPQISSS